jgi:hypothetical protein
MPAVPFQLPTQLGLQLNLAMAALGHLSPSPLGIRAGVSMPHFVSPKTAIEALADRYHLERPNLDLPDLTAGWKSINQRFVPALRSHFDERAQAIQNGQDLLDQRLCGSNIEDAVRLGLLSYDTANVIVNRLWLSGMNAFQEGVEEFRGLAKWEAPDRLLSRAIAYLGSFISTAAILPLILPDKYAHSLWPFVAALSGVVASAGAIEYFGARRHNARVSIANQTVNNGHQAVLYGVTIMTRPIEKPDAAQDDGDKKPAAA